MDVMLSRSRREVLRTLEAFRIKSAFVRWTWQKVLTRSVGFRSPLSRTRLCTRNRFAVNYRTVLRCWSAVCHHIPLLWRGKPAFVVDVLQDTTTGETLCVKDDPIILEKMDFPDPVIKVQPHFVLCLFLAACRCVSRTASSVD